MTKKQRKKLIDSLGYIHLVACDWLTPKERKSIAKRIAENICGSHRIPK